MAALRLTVSPEILPPTIKSPGWMVTPSIAAVPLAFTASAVPAREGVVNNVGRSVGVIPPVRASAGTSKLRILPAWEIRTSVSPGMAVKVIFPSGASMVPVLITVPPIRLRLAPGVRLKLPALMMAPG